MMVRAHPPRCEPAAGADLRLDGCRRFQGRGLTRPHPLRHHRSNGGTDAEPRWILPRRVPRSGQRGAYFSGWLAARSFALRSL
jgi:hypothetical protein